MKAIVKKCARYYKELYAISTELVEEKYNFNTQDKKETPVIESEITSAKT